MNESNIEQWWFIIEWLLQNKNYTWKKNLQFNYHWLPEMKAQTDETNWKNQSNSKLIGTWEIQSDTRFDLIISRKNSK